MLLTPTHRANSLKLRTRTRTLSLLNTPFFLFTYYYYYCSWLAMRNANRGHLQPEIRLGFWVSFRIKKIQPKIAFVAAVIGNQPRGVGVAAVVRAVIRSGGKREQLDRGCCLAHLDVFCLPAGFSDRAAPSRQQRQQRTGLGEQADLPQLQFVQDVVRDECVG